MNEGQPLSGALQAWIAPQPVRREVRAATSLCAADRLSADVWQRVLASIDSPGCVLGLASTSRTLWAAALRAHHPAVAPLVQLGIDRRRYASHPAQALETYLLRQLSNLSFRCQIERVRALNLGQFGLSRDRLWVVGGLVTMFSPGLTRLDLSDNQLRDDDLAPLAHLRHLVDLDLGDNQLHGQAELWATLAQLPSLSRLGVAGNPMAYAQWDGLRTCGAVTALNLAGLGLPEMALARVVAATGLRHLDVSCNGLSGLRALPVTRLAALEYLDLSANDIDNDLLGRLGVLRGLTGLVISNNEAGVNGSLHLGCLTGLRSLAASESGLAGHIFQPGDLSALTELDLSGNCLSAVQLDGVCTLSHLVALNMGRWRRSPMQMEAIGLMTTLSRLCLRECELTGKLLQPLAHAHHLVALDIGQNPLLSAAEVSRLAALSGLRTLDLEGLPIGPRLFEVPGRWPNLSTLILSFSRFRDHGLATLTGRSALRRLQLEGLSLTPRAIPHLAAMPWLMEIDVSRNPKLRQAFVDRPWLHTLARVRF